MNKLVIISGSSRGLGSSIARSFVKNGYKVAINYFKSEDKAQNLAAELGDAAKAFAADISDLEQVKSMLSAIEKEFGMLPSVLVNNAMTEYSFNGDARKTAETISWEELSNHLDVTLKGSLNLIQSLLPSMKENHYGRVINVGTNLVQNPVVPYHDYTIAKAALLGLTRTFAKDLGPMGITVNMVSGGLLKVTDASAATPDVVFDAIADMTPLKKITTVEDFADATLFFASENSRSITGQNLTVDGGLTFN
ncbi:MAG: 3-oxoacyl-ACP reductase [Saprospiraceae bacterium]|nr:3-oxoacyl-ACP reductase [Saprospiraceae bacterium]